MPIIAGYVVPHPPIIVPDIGGTERFKVQSTIDAYKKIAQEIVDYNPDTLIITTPHAKAYRDVLMVSEADVLTGNFSMFRAPNIQFRVPTNRRLVQRILDTAQEEHLPILGDNGQDQSLDHGTMVPLYFLQEILSKVMIVRISTSGLSSKEHYILGKKLNAAVNDSDRVIWIASGDLSHKLTKDGPYGYIKEGPLFDQSLIKILQQNRLQDVINLDTDTHKKAAVCGLGSFAMMFGAVSDIEVHTELLSYEGPFGVGYAVASIKPQITSPHVHLAKRAIEYYLKEHKYLPIDDTVDPELLHHQAGVFVSIHKHGQLRGCIGTTQSTTSSTAEEIIHNAVAAANRDFRFSPIKQKELPDLDISVDVLYPPEPIDSIDQLDVRRYGVIVRYGYQTGLLLPNLDGIDTPEYQVSIALRKAGIDPDEPYRMERFEVKRYH